jgi:GTPase SAR1 family protein
MDEEYEILPKDELDYLRKEVEKLKKNPLGDSKKSRTLYEAVEDLNKTIKKLLTLFESTQQELIKEYTKARPNEILNDVLDQNEKIAKGTLAVADMIKQQQEDITTIKKSLTNPKTEEKDLSEPVYDNKIPDMNSPFSTSEKKPEMPTPPLPNKD